MSRTQHFVVLSPEDRSYLQELLRRGVSSAQAQRRVRILLKADRAARGPG